MALCIVFMGCEKEGVYNPGKKIKRVSEQVSSVKLTLSEWTWEKNLLTKIQNYSGTIPSIEERFVYEKNRISKVNNSNGSYWIITYQNNLYDKIEFFAPNGQTLTSIRVTYENKKVSKLDYTEYEYGKSMEILSNGSFISTLLSPQTIRGLQMLHNKSKDTKITNYSITYTYNGDNIKEEVLTANDEEYILKVTYKYEKYDTNLNPMYHSFLTITDSKNNPLEVIVDFMVSLIDLDETIYDRSTITYDYYYDGKFPKEIVSLEKDSDGVIYKNQTFYDYQ